MFKAANAFEPGFLSQSPETLWALISPHYSIDESLWLQELLAQAQPSAREKAETAGQAFRLVEQVRQRHEAVHVIDALLQQYSLNTREGILLMCLAESLMRIPDAETADALIRDKMSVADWEVHLSKSQSLLVNASTWGLLLSGKVIKLDSSEDGSPSGVICRLVNRLGEPVIRRAVHQAMKIMGRHFVLGSTMKEALKNSRRLREKGYTCSFDRLGEAALTRDDAARYHQAYREAIEQIGADPQRQDTVSIKLSALHPRYQAVRQQQVLTELFEAVLRLVRLARTLGVGITIDAEEQDRLELSLRLFGKLYRHPDCQGWGQLGLAVQAYGKRALPVLSWLAALSIRQGDSIPVRLVKGAYWDSEIKWSQQLGLSGYPVYTRKEATDVSYLVCARFLLSEPVRGRLLPRFASHNAQTVASILTLSDPAHYEFQRLHGMGEALYDTVLEQQPVAVRIYAPVGQHKDLLPYLVRRLLENGANSSFVHRLVDARTPVAALVQHPVDILKSRDTLACEQIPLPEHLYGSQRKNSRGININIHSQWRPFREAVAHFLSRRWRKSAIVNGEPVERGRPVEVFCPYLTHEQVGVVYQADADLAETALASAFAAFPRWHATAVAQRTQCLERLAELLAENQAELVALCHREAGKTIQDSLDEVREAMDFCRYYAAQGRHYFQSPQALQGITGETNTLYLSGRGVFLCISPWNFPLAIFVGQLVAALVAGNTVLAKPAEQTSLIAGKVFEYMKMAGFPDQVIQLLPGDGATIAAPLLRDDRLAGVAFTGSTQTAQAINRQLARRTGAIIPLVAETGGQNAMIVDSSALPEQVVQDVMQSAFGSAGQRCSALRVLYLQDDIADRVIDLLRGAMAELCLGDPAQPETDLGPVIDDQAQRRLNRHIARMRASSRVLAEVDLPTAAAFGYFVAPVVFEIRHISQLEHECFGPVLHLIRYKAAQLDQVIGQINDCGYGLTLGIQSRNEARAAYIEKQVRVGNTYINRNQVGAVVGVQPFGGMGLSGTGPKAGGPYYLLRFAMERTLTVNTAAIGGNASLLSLGTRGC